MISGFLFNLIVGLYLFRTSNFIGPGSGAPLLFLGLGTLFCCLFYGFLSQSCEAL